MSDELRQAVNDANDRLWRALDDGSSAGYTQERIEELIDAKIALAFSKLLEKVNGRSHDG